MKLINLILLALGKKPIVGVSLSGSSYLGGKLIQWGYTPEFHELLNQCLQTLAFLVTIFVGVLTAIAWFRKQRKNN
uniref:hypothetical protein n=1 Tax=uncultured Draconibacterium sp. TaxID=1573823 RepID=UPI0032178A79